MSLEKKIPKQKNNVEQLIFCDYKNCNERGEYIRCYFDIYKNCPYYITHRNYLKTIREIKRHHQKNG